MKTILPILLIGVLFCAVTTVRAQSIRIAYVSSSKIFQEYPAAQDAQKKIDLLAKTVRDSLDDVKKEYQDKLDDYQKKQALMNDVAKKAREQELAEIQARYQEIQMRQAGTDGELAQESEKILGPIRDRIRAAIAGVAKEGKYNFVFDKTEQIQILLYADSGYDITFKVIDRLLARGK